MAMRRVFGRIRLPQAAPSGRAHVTVELLDVSRVDAPSRVLASQQRHDVLIGSRASVEFDLDAPEMSTASSLSVRVHIDLGKSGTISPGDFITTASAPVSTIGDHGPMDIAVVAV